MTEYRSFRNTDPPAICEIWRSQVPQRACFRPLTPAVLEATVLSKPFFDRHGLIVAVEGEQVVGFAHAGFGPNRDGSALDTVVGSTCMLFVDNQRHRSEVPRELLLRSERYLVDRGARQLRGGGDLEIAPFYLGLYGGTSVPGILHSDPLLQRLLGNAGYTETSQRVVMQRQLAGFRPPVDRKQLQLKRKMQVVAERDPRPTNWWEACTTGMTDRCEFTISARTDDAVAGRAIFWDMEPLASSWGVHARGLTQLEVMQSPEQESITVFLLGEAMRQLAAEGVTLVEIHADAADSSLVHSLEKLAFQEVERGSHFCKAAE